MKNLIAKYESLGFNLSIKEEPLIIACCYRSKSKSRFPKPLFNYRFRSIERMEEFCKEWFERVETNIKSENERKAKKKEAQKVMNHNYKVGMILYNSWGYDQTNIDFYQIVEIKEKSIKIRAISSAYVSGSEGFMCANVVPLIDRFKSEPILKKVNISVSYNGSISYYIKAEHGCFCEYSKESKGVYSSWYA
ncbi:hypothetical protein UFOVP19_58 [uncultured Caudovirales phage]|uniref:Uncharacterized protein n=1 Tax=uncultured Caudovirales phage TaxID=2100421 RepID=A0A6J5KLV0_9CAUD|nr:hypothetical protein UFOVP19_58 [uncultured Caudovirales phage]